MQCLGWDPISSRLHEQSWLKGYLAATKNQGLKYEVNEEKELMINVYTDASFAPNAEESHGCFFVMVGDHPVFWRSGKQSTVTLSTAEAEMNEVIEGMIAGESIGVIMHEIVGCGQSDS